MVLVFHLLCNIKMSPLINNLASVDFLGVIIYSLVILIVSEAYSLKVFLFYLQSTVMISFHYGEQQQCWRIISLWKLIIFFNCFVKFLLFIVYELFQFLNFWIFFNSIFCLKFLGKIFIVYCFFVYCLWSFHFLFFFYLESMLQCRRHPRIY